MLIENIKKNRIYALKNEIGYYENEINKLSGTDDKSFVFMIWIYKEIIKSKKILIEKIEKKYKEL